MREDTKAYLFTLLAFVMGALLALVAVASAAEGAHQEWCHVDQGQPGEQRGTIRSGHGHENHDGDYLIETHEDRVRCDPSATTTSSTPSTARPEIVVDATCDRVAIRNTGNEPADIGYGAGEGTGYATIQPGETITFTGLSQFWAVWYVLPNDGYEIIAQGDFYECPPPTTIPGTCHECGDDTTTSTTIEGETASEDATSSTTTTTTLTPTASTTPVTKTADKPEELPFTGTAGLLGLGLLGSALVGGGITVLWRDRA